MSYNTNCGQEISYAPYMFGGRQYPRTVTPAQIPQGPVRMRAPRGQSFNQRDTVRNLMVWPINQCPMNYAPFPETIPICSAPAPVAVQGISLAPSGNQVPCEQPIQIQTPAASRVASKSNMCTKSASQAPIQIQVDQNAQPQATVEPVVKFQIQDGQCGEPQVRMQPSTQGLSQTPSTQAQFIQPKTYMHVPSQGGSGEYVPVSIPCQIAPVGSVPTFAPMEPVSLKFTAPAGSDNSGEPFTFKIDPSVYFGAANARQY